MSLTTVRALTLDLYGTLLDVESSLLQAFTDYLKSWDYPGLPWEVVRAWESAYFQETMIDTLLDHGRTPFEQISRSCLKQTLWKIDIQATAEDIETLLAARVRGTLFPDVQQGLKALASNFSLVILSNGDKDALEQTVANLSLPVTTVISAEQANAYKPHPAVYRTAVQELGLQPTEVMHVASHAWDIRGAKACGLAGAFINRTGAAYDESPFQPDLEVRDFNHLAKELSHSA